MKRVFLNVIFTILIVQATSLILPSPIEATQSIVTTQWRGTTVEYEDGIILLGIKPGSDPTALQNLLLQHNATLRDTLNSLDIWSVTIPANQNVLQTIELMEQSPLLRYAAPAQVMHPTEIPNDPDFYRQWGLHNTGQVGVTDADIDAPEAWDITTGSDNVFIAIFDSGISGLPDPNDITDDHPDLVYEGFHITEGGNFSEDPPALGVRDLRGHGTHVAGIIGATRDNGLGVSGICPDCGLIIQKVAGQYGFVTVEDIVQAYDNSSTRFASIINISYGVSNPDPVLEDVIVRSLETVTNPGVLICASVGNNGSGEILYPAKYAFEGTEPYQNGYPNVLAVGGSTCTDEHAFYSSYNPTDVRVSVVAPGGSHALDFTPHIMNDKDIFSLTPTYDDFYFNGEPYNIPASYGIMGGTSIATAYVSGIAGLLFSERPYLTASQAATIIKESADDIDEPGIDVKTGYGRVNAYEALRLEPHTYFFQGSPGEPEVWSNDHDHIIFGSYDESNYWGCSYIFSSGNETPNLMIEPNTRIVIPDDTFFLMNSASTEISIGHGTEFVFGTGSRFGGGGQVTADGGSENPIIFTSSYINPTLDQYWGGIEFFWQWDAETTFDFVNISYADFGINLYNFAHILTTDYPPRIANGIIQNCKTGIRLKDACFSQNLNGPISIGPSITNTTITGNSAFRGISANNSIVTLTDNDISGFTEGVYVENNSSLLLSRSNISSCSKGILIDNSDYYIEGNTLSNNSIGIDISWAIGKSHHLLDNDVSDGTIGIFIFNSVSQLGYSDMPEGTENIIQDNSRGGLVVLDKSKVVLYRNIIQNNGAEEIAFDHYSQPNMDGYINQIVDDGGYQSPSSDEWLIRCLDHDDFVPRPEPHHLRKNYWGSDYGENRFEPGGFSSFDIFPIWEEPARSASRILYLQAEEAVALEDYAQAKTLYQQISMDYPESEEAPASLNALYYVEQSFTQNFPALRTWYDNYPHCDLNQSLAKVVNHFTTLCHVAEENYAEAIARLETIIQNPANEFEETFAIIDLGYVYRRMTESGNAGPLASIGTMPELRPACREDFMQTKEELLAHIGLGTSSSHGDDGYTAIHESGVLLQNYPNPFNPSTVISFQLPVASKIELSIYNTSGQLVKELETGNWQPGTHEVTWDGTNDTGQPVGSGIYFYRLKTSNGYEATRSMILLK